MRKDVELEVCRHLPERIEADVVVAGFFSDDRPLRGGAGRLDWRLCGQISELLEENRLTGELGSAVLFPGLGPIAAVRVLLLGLGCRKEFGVSRVREVVEDAVRRCLGLGAKRMALTLLGIAPDDFSRNAEAFVEGLTEGVRHAKDLAEDDVAPLRVILALSSRRWHDDTERLATLLAHRSEPQFTLRVESSDPRPIQSPLDFPTGRSLVQTS